MEMGKAITSLQKKKSLEDDEDLLQKERRSFVLYNRKNALINLEKAPYYFSSTLIFFSDMKVPAS